MDFVKRHWLELGENWRFAILAFLIARLWFTLWSLMILTIRPVSIQYYMDNDQQPGVIFISLHASTFYNYLREAQGKTLAFTAVDEDIVTDIQTNSRWDIRTGVAIGGPFAGVTLPQASESAEKFIPYLNSKAYPHAWLAIWQRWDANWYTSIAEIGYQGIHGSEHFPPLYPLLIRLTMPIFGNSFLSGLLISHLATFFVIKLLYDLFNQWDKTKGKQAVIYFLVFPSSFFLFSAYSESLFLVLTLLTLRSMSNKDWKWAGFWIFCATLTRLQGVVLVIPLLYFLWRDHPFLRKPDHWTSPAIAGTGILFYFYLRSVVSNDLIIPTTESAWPTRLVPPWEAYGYAIQTLLFSEKYKVIDFLNWIVTTLIFIAILYGWKKLPSEYTLYTAVSFFIVTARIVETQPLSGMLRFALSLFPVFYVFSSSISNPWLQRIIMYTCIIFNLFLSAEFFEWGWVA